MTCQHRWNDVLARPAPGGGSEQVARWCDTCGAVRVDLDFDGRTRPGDQTHVPTVATSHDELLAVCKEMREQLDAAIAKAEGGP